MSVGMLLIDIGNTRIKWAVLSGEEINPQHAVAHALWTAAECESAFAALARPERILVSNVGGDRVGDIVRGAARKLWALEPQFIHSTVKAAGITNAYPEPSNLGVDRWLAMIGARAVHREPLCIVGVGTAATIDGVDASGQHLGGLIIPGPDLMVDTLLRNTSEIARRAKQGVIDEGLFANNTLGAIRQGSAHAVAALADRAMESMQARVGVRPTLILTGGASAEVARLIRFPHMLLPDLVLRGLAVLAREAP
jgi:type III pantothenate kinase